MTGDQCRLFFTGDEKLAKAAFEWLGKRFEDDGHAVAIEEIDEANAIFQTSIYPLFDADEIEATFSQWVDENAPGISLSREALEDVDWVSKSLEGLKPVRAGRFIVHGRHDRPAVRPGMLSIEIEAGQAFGTGHHGTTAGCLLMMQDIFKGGIPQNLLDLGTGSAVLAIAAAKLGVRKITATDIDPVAIEVAEQNVSLNGVRSRIRCETAGGLDHSLIQAGAPYDLIVANILAGPLKTLAPAMGRHLRPGGSVLLSGILDSQRRSVIAAYAAQKFRHIRTIHREGWSTIHLQR